MKIKTFLLGLFMALSFSLFAQGGDVAPEPQIDSNLVNLIQDLAANLETVINNVAAIKNDSPGAPVTPEGVQWWQSLLYIVSTFLLPFILRKLANGTTKFENIIGFLGKIKDNGILSIVSAAIVVIVGLIAFKGKADTLTIGEIISYFTSIFGYATIVYIFMKFVTGKGSKTPKLETTTPQPDS